MRGVARLLPGLALLALCTCSHYQDEVGTVEVAVQSVAPFQDYVEGLQPKFELSATKALDEVAPVTQVREVERLRAVAASLKAAFSGPGGEGKVPDAPAPSDAPAAPLPTPTPLPSADAKALPIEPMLRYRTAAALFQEVALLSSYVRDGAVRRGTRPYVVRLLVSVFPRTRSTAYDAYVTVTFVPNRTQDEDPLVIDRSWGSIPPAERDFYRRSVTSIDKDLRPHVEVVPLFVTDSLESSARSFSGASSTDLGLSAAGGVGTTALSGGGSFKKRDADRALGRAVSGAQTVGRVSESTIEVRLGASFLDDSYALVPRTYSVTALLLLPTANTLVPAAGPESNAEARERLADLFHLKKGSTAADVEDERRWRLSKVLPWPSVRYHAAASFFHAKTGERALLRDTAFVKRRMKEAGFPADAQGGADIASSLQSGEGTMSPVPGYLLPRLLRIRAELGLSTGSFTVPEQRFAFFREEHLRRSLLRDDGKKSATVKLAGATGLSPIGELSAFVTATWKDGTVATRRAAKAEVAPDGRSATLEFPSLEIGRPECPAAGGKRTGCALAEARLSLSYRPPRSPWEGDAAPEDIRGAEVPLEYVRVSDETPAPRLALAVPVKRLLVKDDGTGELAVEVREASVDSGILSVAGADITEIVGNVTAKGADRIVSGGQILKIRLANLIPPGKIDVRLRKLEDPHDDAPGSPAPVELVVPTKK